MRMKMRHSWRIRKWRGIGKLEKFSWRPFSIIFVTKGSTLARVRSPTGPRCTRHMSSSVATPSPRMPNFKIRRLTRKTFSKLNWNLPWSHHREDNSAKYPGWAAWSQLLKAPLAKSLVPSRWLVNLKCVPWKIRKRLWTLEVSESPKTIRHRQPDKLSARPCSKTTVEMRTLM